MSQVLTYEAMNALLNQTAPVVVRRVLPQVDFYAFNAVVSVILYNIPTQAEATLVGKTRKQIMQEVLDLHKQRVRQEGQKGHFLHLTWTHQPLATGGFLPIQEVNFV